MEHVFNVLFPSVVTRFCCNFDVRVAGWILGNVPELSVCMMMKPAAVSDASAQTGPACTQRQADDSAGVEDRSQPSLNDKCRTMQWREEFAESQGEHRKAGDWVQHRLQV